ncbi:Multiple RNA-binding domain-containing protein 1 [Lambiella insularis]|nr:Multiple RNA-binding domain-containing protein 1 [Lambiella insularis]
MESSRVFVRGLPPNLSYEEFKTHFSKLSPVTDAKFMPHRRIGYVGYKTHHDAAKAVKYFNKSYIRMSRVAVDIARPIIGSRAAEQTKVVLSDEAITPSTAKRKQKAKAEMSEQSKLQEFLEVMQPPSKSKIWANEDAAGSGVNHVPVAERTVSHQEDVASDKEYEHVQKRRKKLSYVDLQSQKMTEPILSTNGVRNVEQHVGNEMAISNATTEICGERPPAATLKAPSDADWIRSRTSRLLGLILDKDDEAVPSASRVPNETEQVEETIDGQACVNAVHTSNAGSQTHEGSLQQTPEPENLPDSRVEATLVSGRLFVRNLSYITSEDDLRAHFGRYGTLAEVHVSTETQTGTSKGFGYIQYEKLEEAQKALAELDGKPLQGRLLHILPASPKKINTLDDYEISKLPPKKRKQIQMKSEALSSTFKWNSMYMKADAVLSSISNRLAVAKSEIFDPTSSDAAVRQAHAETNIIQETKAYFKSCGINLNAFKRQDFSDTAILVKNFSFGTNAEELREVFEAYGNVKRILLPPAATIAIIEMEQAVQARSAFKAVAYRKFKDSILFLEKAPKEVFEAGDNTSVELTDICGTSTKILATDILESQEADTSSTTTLFVRNLNFSTTTEQLNEVFTPLDGFLSARVKTRTEAKRPGQILSMGFGFLEFRSKAQAQAALAAMNGYKLHGHDLVLKASHKAIDAAEKRRKEDNAKKTAGRKTKIIVKNLPFEASKKDVRSLFSAYGQLRSARVPKKFDSSTRGFAFVDFVTAKEAESAMEALKDTHLLGRRLVLDFAFGDTIDPENEIEKMQRKVGRQADKVAIQKLTSVGRRKFHTAEGDEAYGD